MDRRRFLLTSLAGALAAPLAVEAQPARKVWRGGYLGDAPRAERLRINFEPFRDGLRELGYIEGQNVIIEERWTDGRAERLADLTNELVRLKVDVIVTHGVRATRAAQGATRTVPIVAAVMPDPVGAGLVASLARPGGNTTGTSDHRRRAALAAVSGARQHARAAADARMARFVGEPGAHLRA